MAADNWLADWRTRRNLLKAGAVGGAVAVAGCSGDGDGTATDGDGGDGSDSGDGGDGGDGSDGGDSDTPVEVNEDAAFRMYDHGDAAPPERHLNPWNPAQTGCWYPGAVIMDRPATYSPTQNEVYPIMLDGWEFEDDTTILAEFGDGYTWHNGDDFVAMDYVMEQQIELAVLRDGQAEDEDGPAHAAMEDIETVDDYSCRIHLHTPFAEVFAINNTLAWYHGEIGRGVYTKHDDDRWSDLHDRLWNVGTPETSAIEDLTTANYPAVEDEPIGHGPFQIDTVGDNEIIMTRYGDHPHADEINYGEFHLRYFPQTGQPAQPFTQNEVDATAGGFPLPEGLRSQQPDTTQLYRQGRSINSLFAFNCGNGYETDYPVNDRRVRKAISHVWNRSEIEPLLEGVKIPFEWPACRMPGEILRNDSHEATSLIKEEFELYGTNDTERAAEYLRDYGMEQDDDGAWLTPDGEAWELEILNAAQRNDFNVLQKNLENFGVDVTMNSVDSATFDERRKNGEYQMIPDGSSANGVFAMWAPGLLIDWLATGLVNFQISDVEIPMPIGDPEGANGTKTISIDEHIQNWQIEGDDQYHRELMWWWNQYVPESETMYAPDAGAINTANWELDAPEYITGGIDDAMFLPDKMEGMAIRYTGN